MISTFNRWYRYLFCRKGYGVHSPFVYDLITNVIEEKRPYYCYDSLQKKYLALRKKNGDFLSRKEYELLFRLANRFKPANSLIVANDNGLSVMYLAASSKDMICRTDIGGVEKQDMIVCLVFQKNIVNQLIEYAKEDTVMAVYNIRKDRALWKTVCADVKVSVSIDLGRLGLLFFNPKLHRKTYKGFI